MLTNQKQVRAAFWQAHEDCHGQGRCTVSRKRYGNDRDYNTDTRCAFCDYVDMLARSGEISETLAQRVTL